LLLITTLSLQQEKKYDMFKKFHKLSQDGFFDFASKKIKKPRSKIRFAAVMPLNKIREKISKIGRGDSFLV
jgi:hypothetical protein